MSAKSAMKAQIKRCNTGTKIVSVPEHMRPTPDSIHKMGVEISALLSANEAMRNRSENQAAQRSVQ